MAPPLAAIIAGLLSIVAPGALAGAVVLMIGGTLLSVLVRFFGAGEAQLDARVARWTIVAAGVRLLVGSVALAFPALAGYVGPDAADYHLFAIAVADHWVRGGTAPGLYAGKEGFTLALAALYWIFGPHPVAGVFANCLAGAALVPVVADTTRRLFGRAAAAYVCPYVALLVGLVLWPSQLLREAGVFLLIAVGANAAARMVNIVRVVPVIALAGSVALLLTFRYYVAVLLTGGLILGLAISKRWVGGIGSGATTAGLLLAVVLGLGLGVTGARLAQEASLSSADQVRRDSARSASSGFGQDADVSTRSGALRVLPVSIPSFLLGPFPWQVRGLRHVPALIDAVVLWTLLPKLWRGWKAAGVAIGRQRYLIGMPTFVLVAALSLVIANYGTAVRSRNQVVVLLLPLIGLGVAARRERAAVGLRVGAVTAS